MTDTTSGTASTAIVTITSQYETCDNYVDNSSNVDDTHIIVHDNTPGIFWRRIITTAGKIPSVFPVFYDHRRTQREIAYLKANQTLEEQRND